MSILKIEGQIFSQNIFECPKCPECPSVHSQNRGSDFFLRIFLSVLSVPSGRVSVLKIEGQNFFLRIFSSVLSVPVSFLKVEGLYCLT